MPIPKPRQSASNAPLLRHDWTRPELRALFDLPLPELTFRAQTVHRDNFDPAVVQISTLLSIKTGGCPEDCAYCPQSASYATGVRAEKLMPLATVLAEARAARTAGASRTKTEIKRDFEYLLRMWETVRETTLASSAPSSGVSMPQNTA